MATRSKARAQLKKKRESFNRFLAVMSNEMELQASNASKEVAKALTEEAKVVIDRQLYDWQPLKDWYREQKREEGHDERIFIRTGEFRDAISWGVSHGKVWAGLPSQKIHEGSGMRLVDLARIHEFGYGNVPARPLWRPLLAKYVRLRPDFAKSYRRAIEKAAKKARKS